MLKYIFKNLLKYKSSGIRLQNFDLFFDSKSSVFATVLLREYNFRILTYLFGYKSTAPKFSSK